MASPPANPSLAALAAGKPEAFAALYDRLGRSMLRTAASMLGPTADPEDVVQDVFVSLVRSRSRFEYVEDLTAYVFAVLRHAVARRLALRARERRAMRNLTMLQPQTQNPVPSPDEDLNAALASLPLPQREVVALKIDADLTFAQIGEILSVNPNTAASRYRYALEKLRQALE